MPLSDAPPLFTSQPLPSGTVTFLFTDIEGSTRLWQEQPTAMHSALARHDALAHNIIRVQGGTLVRVGAKATASSLSLPVPPMP